MTAAWITLGLAGAGLAAWAGLFVHIARTVARALDHDTTP